jgi:hypothetical protein
MIAIINTFYMIYCYFRMRHYEKLADNLRKDIEKEFNIKV